MADRTGRSSDSPAPVALNLDKLEQEGGGPGPFVVVLGGRRLELIDAEELDWQIMHDLSERDVRQFMRLVVPEDDQDYFFSQKLSLRAMNTLQSSYRDFYGTTDQGEAAASSPS